MDQFGRIIRELRNELGLSQTDLAGRIGVTRGAIDQWERGLTVPSFNHLVELARVCGVSPGAIIDSVAADGMSVDKELAALPEPTREALRDSFLATIRQFKSRKI